MSATQFSNAIQTAIVQAMKENLPLETVVGIIEVQKENLIHEYRLAMQEAQTKAIVRGFTIPRRDGNPPRS